MMIAAAAVLTALSGLQTPALAQSEGRAQLRLTVVDEANAPLPNTVVTVLTMYGPRTVTTNEKGVVVLAGLPAAMTQWWVRTPEHVSRADATRLKPGQNTETVTAHRAKLPAAEAERSTSGS